jgi:hypothetical protein
VDDVARFRAHDVYRQPRVTGRDRRRDPARFARPDQLWSDLLERSVRRPAFRLVREGSTLKPGALTRKARLGDRDLDDLASPNAVIAGYRRGATVVLQGLHLTDPGLARFANNLALELDQPVQINAYLSPESATGLDVHFDYHDVFVVQLEGTKRWRIWSPIERSVDPVGGKHAIPRPAWEELGEPLLDLVLEEGDVLYLPRGHPHVAETTDRASAHLTIGLLSVTWHRVVRRAIDEAVDDGRLRASIPLGTLDAVPSGPLADDHASRRAAPDLAGLDLDLGSIAVRRWVADEIWKRQASTRLRPRTPVDPAAADGLLDITPGPLVTLSREGDRSLLFLGDRTLSLPDEAHPFLAALLTTEGAFTRTELPGLDDSSSRVVIERLLDEGLLVAAPAEPSEAGR